MVTKMVTVMVVMMMMMMMVIHLNSLFLYVLAQQPKG
jgi:hypothetical protein